MADLTKLLGVAGEKCEHSVQSLALTGNVLQRQANIARESLQYERYHSRIEGLLAIQKARFGEDTERYHHQINELQFAKRIISADESDRQVLVGIDQAFLRYNKLVEKREVGTAHIAKELHRDCLLTLGIEHPKSLAIQSNVAVDESNLGNAGHSLKLIQEVFAQTERLYGNDHILYALAAYRLATANSVVQNMERADSLFEQANLLMEKNWRADRFEHAFGRQLYGRHLKRKGDYYGSLAQLKRAQAILLRNDQTSIPLYQDVLAHLADTHRALGEIREAKKVLDKQKRVLAESGNEDRAALYDVLFSEGMQLLWEVRIQDALRNLRRQRRWRSNFMGSTAGRTTPFWMPNF